MKGINVPPPDYGPVVWNQDEAPIREAGSVEERLHAHMIATVAGDARRSYGLFLGSGGGRDNSPVIARPARISRPHRPAGHDHRAQGAQHRPQGVARACDNRPRRFRRLGAARMASSTWACRTWRSGRCTTRFTTRCACGSPPRSRTPATSAAADQPDTADRGRGRGNGRSADGGRRGRRSRI